MTAHAIHLPTGNIATRANGIPILSRKGGIVGWYRTTHCGDCGAEGGPFRSPGYAAAWSANHRDASAPNADTDLCPAIHAEIRGAAS